MNTTHLMGNLTRDIEIRYGASGTPVAKTAIATTRKYTSNGQKKEEVMFLDITFFGRSAEVANQYLNKGSKILITGRLVFSQWVDNGGNKRAKHELVVENMEMINSNTKAPPQDPSGANMPVRSGVENSTPPLTMDDNLDELF